MLVATLLTAILFSVFFLLGGVNHSVSAAPIPLPTPIVQTVGTPSPLTGELTLLYPTIDSLYPSDRPLFRWTHHPDIKQYKFVLKMGTETLFQRRFKADEVCYDDGVCYYDSFNDATFPILTRGVNYRWRVRAVNQDLASEWAHFSPTATRMICPDPEPSPDCITPPPTTPPGSTPIPTTPSPTQPGITPAPTNAPSATPTSPNGEYLISIGGKTPVISDTSPYALGPCIKESEVHRSYCAVQAYRAVLQRTPSLTWEELLAMTMLAEAAVIYVRADDPTLLPLCVYNDSADAGCLQFRELFEKTAVRNLYHLCNGISCSEAEFVQFLSEMQEWFQAGNPNGVASIDEFYSSQGTVYDQLVDDAKTYMVQSDVQTGCNNSEICSWGNPDTGNGAYKPKLPKYSMSYLGQPVPGKDNYGYYDGRFYFILGNVAP